MYHLNMVKTGERKMDVIYGQQLIDGKRLDEIMNEVTFMNETQLTDTMASFWDLMHVLGHPQTGLDDIYIEFDKRIRYFAELRNQAVDALIADVGGFRHGSDNQAFVKNDNLLDVVKQIFGDLAVAVYTTMTDVNKIQDEESIMIHETDTEVQLGFDTTSFVIEFVNGNRVEFTNSEWASMNRLKQK
jgi:hypothetical protein